MPEDKNKFATWNNSAIRRFSYNFTEKAPIHIRFGRHIEKKAPGFDMHYPLELGIVLSGKMHRIYQNYHMMLSPGQIWMTGIWEPHGSEVPVPPCEIILMLIWPQVFATLSLEEAPDFDWLAPFKVPPEKRPQITGTAERENMLKYAQRLKELTPERQSSTFHRLKLRAQVMDFLVRITENWKHKSSTQKTNSTDNFSKIGQAMDLVFNSKRLVTVEEAAELCGQSVNTFSRKFKDAMGISFPVFSLRYRLTSAAKDLAQTKDPVKVIAYRWGFTDVSHMHHRFIKHFGCSPSEYRNQN